MSTVTAAPVDRLLYTPEQAAEALSIGRSTLYELMADRVVKYIKLGRCRRPSGGRTSKAYVANLVPLPN
ncbi:helix-turn-helix domain-containing protein [Streptomyces tricolor]|nr:helix-turn-helix domain-containing protein [Streptomyces tricolor]